MAIDGSNEDQSVENRSVVSFDFPKHVRIPLPANVNLGNLSSSTSMLSKNMRAALQSFEHSSKPVQEAQARISRKMKEINTNLTEQYGPLQEQLNQLAKDLTSTLEISGLSATLQKVLSEQGKWLQHVAQTIHQGYINALPSNFHARMGFNFEGIQKTVLMDGISLYGVPRASIVKSLLDASTTQERRNILLGERRNILADCQETLVACDCEEVENYVTMAQHALKALDDGHHQAGQALLASLSDTILTEYLGEEEIYNKNKQEKYRKFIPNKNNTKTQEAYDKLRIRQFLALGPTWQSFQTYDKQRGDAIPENFSRHATAHTVNPVQFTPTNAVQAAMYVCGMIRFIHDEAARKSGKTEN